MLAQWVRNVFIAWVCFIWGLFIIGSWHKGNEIPNYVWGVPGAIYFAMNPTFRISRHSERAEATTQTEE